MRILVTGSDGKIAKELIKQLHDHTLLLVDKKTGHNLNDPATQNLIKEFLPEVVFHLAASFERTDESSFFHSINYEDNILASYNLNRVISDISSVRHYIFASSYLVYDPFLYLAQFPLKYAKQLSEVDELNPRNLVGASKLYIEKEINFIKRNIHKHMKVSHARIFRVFGEGGQEFISRLLDYKKYNFAVDIWKPENRFDYIHTSDCAAALMALMNNGCEGEYNVGYGVSVSIESIIKAVNPIIKHIHKDDLFEASYSDNDKIEEATGWIPKVNVLDWIKEKL